MLDALAPFGIAHLDMPLTPQEIWAATQTARGRHNRHPREGGGPAPALQVSGQPGKAVQYDIGNPLTATRMTQHQLPASFYAPLRVVLYENDAGRATFEYDRPSSLFG